MSARDLIYAASVRAGIPPEFRPVLFAYFEELPKPRCPFANLPERTEGRWGEGPYHSENGYVSLVRSIHRGPHRVLGMDA
jgi:hypothetical protein